MGLVECVVSTKLATRRTVDLPEGDNLEETFRLIQQQAISAVRQELDAETSDEGPSTPSAAGKSSSDFASPGDSIQEPSSPLWCSSTTGYSLTQMSLR